jgi:hypothetical protein
MVLVVIIADVQLEVYALIVHKVTEDKDANKYKEK